MDFRRYTINQLSKLTGTSKHLLYSWVHKGFLVPTQISGNRQKFSLDAFLTAEKLALKEKEREKLNQFLYEPQPNQKIPDNFIDYLFKQIKQSPSLKAKSNHGNKGRETLYVKQNKEVL
jgi:DNA-binding transcriptional MerR regulator